MFKHSSLLFDAWWRQAEQKTLSPLIRKTKVQHRALKRVIKVQRGESTRVMNEILILNNANSMQCLHLFSLSHLLNNFGITIERLIFSEIHQTWRTLRKSLPQRWSGSREPSRSHRHRRTPPSPPPPSPPRARRTWWRRWTGSPWSGATTRRPRRSLNSEGGLSSHSKSLLGVIFLIYHVYL